MGQICFPTKQRMKKISVIFGECGISAGRCDKYCGHADVEEDTECECACDVHEEDCDAEDQEFNEDQCECQCRNQTEKKECLDKGKYWDEGNCKCRCEVTSDCSFGLKFSDKSCSCIETNIPDRLSTSGKVVDMSSEFLIILVLGCSIFIMFIILSIVLMKLKRLKKKLKIQESVKSVQNLQNYYQVSTNVIHKDKYEQVYTDSVSYESNSDNSKEENNETDQEDIYQSIETVQLNPKKDMFDNNRYKADFKAAAEPIDQALMILKMSADQL